MSFWSFGPVDGLDFSILLSWGCSFLFFFFLQFWRGRERGASGILRIKVIVWGYLQPAACIKWRLEECTLKVQGKYRGPGIWELHSCEPKGKGWGFMANFFWCHVILKPTSESITSSFQGKTGLGIGKEAGAFASLRKFFWGKPKLLNLGKLMNFSKIHLQEHLRGGEILIELTKRLKAHPEGQGSSSNEYYLKDF